ncbi:MAG: hypothetical protein AMXMBFR81_03100 [Chthonomonas sp.]
MDRANSEGLPRNQLLWALSQPRFVLRARKMDACLLCCAHRVNEAGLCESCHASLSDEELRVVERWLIGIGP